MRIFLDDLRQAPLGWVHTKSVQETIQLLGNFNVTEISLDHDLGDDVDGNGYDVLCWIEEQVARNYYSAPMVHVHTDNPSAREKMVSGVRALGRVREIVDG